MGLSEVEQVAIARGDEVVFGELVAPLHGQLHAHCYRMLGSVHDADDAMQDVLLRAWQGLAGFHGRSSLRTWMYRIATNVCLTMIERGKRRVLPMEYPSWLDQDFADSAMPTESAWLEPYPNTADEAGPEPRYERRESLELAFVAAIQHLPGNERAALLLCEVVGYSAREVAELMEVTVPAVNSALQRARRLVGERVPEQSQQTALRALGDARVRELVDRYASALERADLDALIGMLTDGATWSMPPFPAWYRGRSSITAFLVAGPLHGRWRHLPTWANGQPALGCYEWNAERGAYVGTVLDVLTVQGDRIAAVTAFVDPAIIARFGLPAVLA
ncbi:sigma-70 family RNA polymerase sigma factor [Nocardia altamirensis]|uniref:sigma-70 family RNA polymerase sigma factor n=1 Tax=Nocardia altamirensis TaxID=472158 RepID=UPI00084038EA|nr:sigma-70 family RNA polymerase sigma factor [Nocardia altamirensis]